MARNLNYGTFPFLSRIPDFPSVPSPRSPLSCRAAIEGNPADRLAFGWPCKLLRAWFCHHKHIISDNLLQKRSCRASLEYICIYSTSKHRCTTWAPEVRTTQCLWAQKPEMLGITQWGFCPWGAAAPRGWTWLWDSLIPPRAKQPHIQFSLPFPAFLKTNVPVLISWRWGINKQMKD